MFEPRDETGIAASMFCQKLILFDEILLDHRSIREFGDVSTVSNLSRNKSSSKELEVANNVPRTYSMYDHTSVRLLKIYNKMAHHSSRSNDTGFKPLGGARFP